MHMLLRLACLAVRFAFAWLAWLATHRAPLAFAAATAVPAVGFSVLYVTRARETGIESSAPGGTIWWNDLRPLHAANWFAATLMALRRGRDGGPEPGPVHVPLLVDAVVGAGAFASRGFIPRRTARSRN